MSSADTRRFVVLDSFRGLCALCVVVFHQHLLQGFSELTFFRSAGLMVEFFFTLSGFVLAHRYRRESFDRPAFGQFVISRSFRVLPLHLTMLLLFSLPLLWQLISASIASGQIHALLTGSGLKRQWLYQLFLLQAWLPAADPFAFNGPAWSISVEYYLYLGFGLVLLLDFRRSQIAFAVIVALCSLAVLLRLDFTSSGGFRGITCFFTGALAYGCLDWLQHRRPDKTLGTLLEVLTVLILYYVITGHYPAKSFIATWVFSIAIILFSFESGVVSQLLHGRWFVKLGQWSFSIYLTHYALLHVLQWTMQRFWPEALVTVEDGPVYLSTDSYIGDNLLGIAMLVLVVLISRISYRQIELRGIAWGKAWSRR